MSGIHKIGFAVLCAATLTACETTLEPEAIEASQTTPPEYMRCADVPAALSYADAVVREFPATTTTSEAEYWRDRQRRLVARAYECDRRR